MIWTGGVDGRCFFGWSGRSTERIQVGRVRCWLGVQGLGRRARSSGRQLCKEEIQIDRQRVEVKNGFTSCNGLTKMSTLCAREACTQQSRRTRN